MSPCRASYNIGVIVGQGVKGDEMTSFNAAEREIRQNRQLYRFHAIINYINFK